MEKPDFDALAAQFAEADLEWRIGQISKKGDKATVLVYLTSRAVMDRLDAVVGAGNWRDEYQAAPQGGLMCGLSIRVGDEWITKWDGAENTKIESVKGGVSGALKRAAVKWGIGRYLYYLEGRYLPIREGYGRDPRAVNTRGGHVIPPTLPAWALPGGRGRPGEPEQSPEPVDPFLDAMRRASDSGRWSRQDGGALVRFISDGEKERTEQLNKEERERIIAIVQQQTGAEWRQNGEAT